MKKTIRFFACFLLLFAFFADALPCGPGYTTPVFDVRKAPEFPYADFAAGRIGIVKPTFHRSVLFAAYRYLNGGAFSPDEQKTLVEVWRAEFRKEDYRNIGSEDFIKLWVAKRKEVAGEEEKLPQIYVERQYGGYDFFPNCTEHAFETATATLTSRISSHGAEDANVKEWLRGQDTVFANCSSGKQMPVEPHPGMSEWLQKDRAYQMAAASFYSLDYNDAKRRFGEIALDFQSPWQETSDYLVARTLIRQASLSRPQKDSERYYREAHDHLSGFVSTSGRFSDSAERLMGLVKYRLFPEERVIELAQKLSFQGGNQNFRQELIDYTWLMDKFEREALETAERRRLEEILKGIDINDPKTESELTPEQSRALNRLREIEGRPHREYQRPFVASSERQSEDDLEIWVMSDDYARSWRLYVPSDANDSDAIAEAERVIGEALTAEMKEKVISARQSAYSNRFSSGRSDDYQGGYYGDISRSLSVLPTFLRSNEQTDWLFTYQLMDEDAYRYSLGKYKATGLDLWLMTSLSKASRDSEDVTLLLSAAKRASQTSPAYPTIAFHTARLQIDLGKNDEAKKVLDGVLGMQSVLPLSATNQFLELRQKLSLTVDEFLQYSLRRPYTFDFGGSLGSIEDMIEEAKSYFNPEYHTEGREAYEKQIEENFRAELPWQHRMMFDNKTTATMNLFFPTSVLLEVSRSQQLPDYLRQRFVVAVWMRAALVEDYVTANSVAPELARHFPEMAESLKFIQIASTPSARRNAVLYLLISNPVLTPFIEDGIGKTDNTQDVWDSNDWWCEPYDEFYDEEIGDTVSRASLKRPPFLTPTQNAAADKERQRLKTMGNAATYLGEQVMAWATRTPNDKRIPEVLYKMHEANGWSKYGCGGNFELQSKIAELMKRRYPNNEWTRRLLSETEADN